jgi:hypothetical protein
MGCGLGKLVMGYSGFSLVEVLLGLAGGGYWVWWQIDFYFYFILGKLHFSPFNY